MLLVTTLLVALATGQAEDRPNILFIYRDDHSAAAVGVAARKSAARSESVTSTS